MKKQLLIAGVALLILLAVYWVWQEDVPSCPPARNPGKFPEGWLENAIPSGDLYRLAEKYAKPVIGGDSQKNGSIVGGFFKGIDVYPSESAAKYYKSYLIKYLKSNQALPHWNVEIGELLCKN